MGKVPIIIKLIFIRKVVLAYFPIILTLIQLMINFIYFIDEAFYRKYAFGLNISFGFSLIYAFFLVLYTSYFPFCKVSRITAYCQVIIVLAYAYIKEDNVYNIVVQSVLMFSALMITLYYYVKTHPKCRFSLYVKAKMYTLQLWETFLKSLSKENFKCEDALKDYQLQRQKYYDGQNY